MAIVCDRGVVCSCRKIAIKCTPTCLHLELVNNHVLCVATVGDLHAFSSFGQTEVSILDSASGETSSIGVDITCKFYVSFTGKTDLRITLSSHDGVIDSVPLKLLSVKSDLTVCSDILPRVPLVNGCISVPPPSIALQIAPAPAPAPAAVA